MHHAWSPEPHQTRGFRLEDTRNADRSRHRQGPMPTTSYGCCLGVVPSYFPQLLAGRTACDADVVTWKVDHEGFIGDKPDRAALFDLLKTRIHKTWHKRSRATHGRRERGERDKTGTGLLQDALDGASHISNGSVRLPGDVAMYPPVQKRPVEVRCMNRPPQYEPEREYVDHQQWGGT